MSLEVTEETADLQQLTRLSLPTGICAFPAVINTTATTISNPEHIIEPCVYPVESYVVEQLNFSQVGEEYVEIRVHPHINEQQQQQQVDDSWVQNVNSNNPQQQNFS